MKKRTKRAIAGVVGPLAITATFAGSAAAVDSVGPNTTVLPYVSTSAPFAGVDIQSLLTVNQGAATNGYKMVGIPDGMGARLNGQGLVETFVNHELGATAGIARAHGQKGAFVSKFTINPATKEVVSGADVITSVQYFNYTTATYGAAPGGTISTNPAFGRFCSGNLATAAQLFNAATGNGFNGDLYLAGEEVGTEGRLFATDPATGVAYQLPRLGLFSWENGLPNKSVSDKTIVAGQDDSNNGPLWVYEGTKTSTGLPIDKAGLTNGTNFVVKLAGTTNDLAFRTSFGKNNPQAVTFESVNWNQTGAAQRTEALTTKGALQFGRVEDGAWDKTNPNVFWFVTTGQGTAGNAVDTGLWKLTLTSAATGVSAGATLTLVLDGSEIPTNDAPGRLPTDNPDLTTLDNIDVDSAGRVVMQEDPGGVIHRARVIVYRPSDGALRTLGRFTGGPYNGASTIDEESSGIIDTKDQFGPNTFLINAQIHSNQALPAGTGPGTVEEFVENGQLMLMTINWPQVFGDPDPVVPEAPVVVMLGLSAIAIIGGGVVLMKRRNGLTLA